MNIFNEKSKLILSTTHPDLQKIFTEVVKGFDCTIICGHRNELDQNEAYRIRASKLKWPDSKHNSIPARAVDVVPYPLDWKDINRMYYFAGYVKAKAETLNIKIIWGGDWDNDTEVNDQSFLDLPHFELRGLI